MMPSIISQIDSKESDIKSCEERLESIERSLRLRDHSDSQRQSLRAEEKRVKESLDAHGKQLRDLRKENWKTSILSFAVIILVYICYYYLWSP